MVIVAIISVAVVMTILGFVYNSWRLRKKNDERELKKVENRDLRAERNIQHRETLKAKSGKYEPLTLNVLNVISSSIKEAIYFRIDNVVTVSGRIDLTMEALEAATEIGIIIPVISRLSNESDLIGIVVGDYVVGKIKADVVNGRASIEFKSGSAVVDSCVFQFSYQIKQ